MTLSHPHIKIAVDSGHGGSDPGAIWPIGSDNPTHTEADIALATGRRVVSELRRYVTNIVYHVRGTSTGLTLSSRVNFINRHADLALSLHCNASTNLDAQGIWLIHDDQTNEAHVKRAQNLATELKRALETAHFSVPVIVSDNTGHVGGRDLAIVSNTTVPTVLIEMGFITNHLDRSRFASPSTMGSMATAIAMGVRNYLRMCVPAPAPAPAPVTLEEVAEMVSSLNDRVAALERQRVN